MQSLYIHIFKKSFFKPKTSRQLGYFGLECRIAECWLSVKEQLLETSGFTAAFTVSSSNNHVCRGM